LFDSRRAPRQQRRSERRAGECGSGRDAEAVGHGRGECLVGDVGDLSGQRACVCGGGLGVGDGAYRAYDVFLASIFEGPGITLADRLCAGPESRRRALALLGAVGIPRTATPSTLSPRTYPTLFRASSGADRPAAVHGRRHRGRSNRRGGSRVRRFAPAVTEGEGEMRARTWGALATVSTDPQLSRTRGRVRRRP
jgi:hypothetical protein